jgi:hypothetical protein
MADLLVRFRVWVSDGAKAYWPSLDVDFEKVRNGHTFDNWKPISKFGKGHIFENCTPI